MLGFLGIVKITIYVHTIDIHVPDAYNIIRVYYIVIKFLFCVLILKLLAIVIHTMYMYIRGEERVIDAIMKYNFSSPILSNNG